MRLLQEFYVSGKQNFKVGVKLHILLVQKMAVNFLHCTDNEMDRCDERRLGRCSPHVSAK